MSGIASRASWGARYRDGVGTRPMGALEKYLHHTVTTHLPETATVEQERAQMRVVEAIGQQRFGAGISYSLLVFPSGRIYTGASMHRIAYHSGGGNKASGPAAGRNTGGAGICLVGNYDVHELGDRARDGVVWSLQEGVRRGWWGDPALTEAHRDFKGTACPGHFAYARLDEINRLGRGSEVAAKPAPAPQPTKPRDPSQVVWGGISAADTLGVQQYLKRVTGDYRGLEDGIYGPMMRAAVLQYQQRQTYFPGMLDDGLWGERTQAHLEWVELLQATLNRWRSSYGRLNVDGDHGALTRRRIADVQKRNAAGAYRKAGGRDVDGTPGPITCRMLGMPAHPYAR